MNKPEIVAALDQIPHIGNVALVWKGYADACDKQGESGILFSLAAIIGLQLLPHQGEYMREFLAEKAGLFQKEAKRQGGHNFREDATGKS